MGMDISGRNPTASKGEYFRANIWSWRPIRHIIAQSNILTQEILDEIAFNEGGGPSSASDCHKLADFIEAFMAERGMESHHRFSLDSDLRVDPDTNEFLPPNSTEGVSVYHVTGSHLERFIVFLRHCGGFEVW